MYFKTKTYARIFLLLIAILSTFSISILYTYANPNFSDAELKIYCATEDPTDNGQRANCFDYWAAQDEARNGYDSGAPANSAYSSDTEQIEDYSIRIKVNQDASIDVDETIVYNFGPSDKHGIYRDVPIMYKTKSGANMRLDLQNIHVTDTSLTSATNPSHMFTTSRIGKNRRIKIGDPNQFVSGVHTYDIAYSVPHAVGFFDTFDEIYWNAIGTEWAVPILSSTVTVDLPGFVQEADLKVACYAGVYGSTKSCDTHHNENRGLPGSATKGITTIVFDQGQLNPNEGLTVAVGFPMGLIDRSTAPSSFSIMMATFFEDGWWWIIFPILVFILMYRRWSKFGRDPKGTGVIVPQYESPDNLSPMQISFILKQYFGNISLSAEIIYLATQGFLKISKVTVKGVFASTDDYEFEKLKPADDTLAQFQSKLLDGLFAPDMTMLSSMAETAQTISAIQTDPHASKAARLMAGLVDKMTTAASKKTVAAGERAMENKARLSDLKYNFFPVVEKVQQDCETSLVDGGYFPEGKKHKEGYAIAINGQKGARSLLIVMCALFLIGFGVGLVGVFSGGSGVAMLSYISTVIIWAIFAILMPRMTEKGVLTKEYIKGFKLYLSVAEKDRINFHNAPAKNPAQFEKFLPFAMALGVEKAWAKCFEGITLSTPTWYNDPTMTGFSAVSFASSMSSFSTASSAGLSSSPGSSSGSGGGGSSGGGGGGGGGGSW